MVFLLMHIQWALLSSLVSSLTAFYPKSLDPNRSKEEVDGTIIRILAKLPTLAAWSYKNRMRQQLFIQITI